MNPFVRVSDHLYRYKTNKRYYAVFRKKGKLTFRSLKTTDRKLAERRLLDEEKKAGKVDERYENMLLDDLLKLYEARLPQYAPATGRTRASILKVFRNTWTHGLSVPIREITPAQLELWLAQHRARMKRVSCNEYIRFLHQLFTLAIDSRVVSESPAAGIQMLKKEKPVRVTPSWEQFKAIVQAVRTQKFNGDAEETGELVEFMGLAGLGQAECALIHGEHVDFANSKITLYRAKTNTPFSIPLFPQLQPFMDRLKAECRIQVGQPLFKVRDPKRALAAACIRLGYPNFSPRSLRRCFITRAIEKGVDFKTLASWQGHQDGGALIAKTYSHLRNEHSDAMAKRLVVA